MAAYLMANIQVTDPIGFEAYRQAVALVRGLTQAGPDRMNDSSRSTQAVVGRGVTRLERP